MPKDRYRVGSLEPDEIRVGDFILFHSGPRRVERVHGGINPGYSFVQLRPGQIGGGPDYPASGKTTMPDGVRLTIYHKTDLRGMDVTGVARKKEKCDE